MTRSAQALWRPRKTSISLPGCLRSSPSFLGGSGRIARQAAPHKSGSRARLALSPHSCEFPAGERGIEVPRLAAIHRISYFMLPVFNANGTGKCAPVDTHFPLNQFPAETFCAKLFGPDQVRRRCLYLLRLVPVVFRPLLQASRFIGKFLRDNRPGQARFAHRYSLQSHFLALNRAEDHGFTPLSLATSASAAS